MKKRVLTANEYQNYIGTRDTLEGDYKGLVDMNYQRTLINSQKYKPISIVIHCIEGNDFIEYKITNQVVHISVSDKSIFDWTFNIGYSDEEAGTFYTDHLRLMVDFIYKLEIIEEEGRE